MKAIQKTKSKKSLSERVTAMEGDPRGALATWGRRMAGRTRSVLFVLRQGILSLYSYFNSNRIIRSWRSRTYIQNLRTIRSAGLTSSFLLGLLALAIIIPLYNVSGTEDTEAATIYNPSTSSITFTSTRNTATINLTPSSTSGTFIQSDTSNTSEVASFNVTTNNATGYTLGIASSTDTTSLTNGTDTLPTITNASTGITASTFNTSTYNDMWGYLPSKYNSTANTGSSAKFYPITTTTATLDETDTANTTDNTYTIALGARVTMAKSSGTYTTPSGTAFILTAVGKPASYSIIYNQNTTDTVSNLPDATGIQSTSAQSITLSSTTPARSNYNFLGWCTVATSDQASGTSGSTACANAGGTYYATGGTFYIDETTTNVTTLYAIWEQAGYTITFKTSNATAIVFNGTAYTNNQSIVIPISEAGTYSIYGTYASKYAWSSWSATAGSFGNSSYQNTTYTVTGNATITLTGQSVTLAIQNLSNSNCTATARPVYDTRDNSVYWVQRLADGKCWMLDNLAFDAAANVNSITTSNTNISQAGINALKSGGSSPYSATAISSTWGSTNTNTDARINVSGTSNSIAYTKDSTLVSMDAPTTPNHNKGAYGPGQGKVGVYYNYCAASGGTICPSSNSSSASYDICPAGWRMPTGNYSGEYGALYKNSAIGSDAAKFRIALSTPLSGGISNGLENSQGSSTSFWSSTYAYTGTMYYLYVTDSYLYVQYYGSRYYGYPVRCVMNDLYGQVASMSKGKQTNDTNATTGIQAAITAPTSTDRTQDTSNSGVYEYDASVFGISSDASNSYPIYYYRGILEPEADQGSYGSDGKATTYPNYVKLGNNTCWRILRTTGSRGVKLIYNGTYGATTSGSCANATSKAHLTDGAFDRTADSSSKSIVGVGYTYNASYKSTETTTAAGTLFGTNSSYSGNSTSSTMKTYIEDIWYKSNMDSYTSMLEPSAGYCNDRSVNSGSSWTSYSDSTSITTPYTSGSSATQFNFGPSMRNYTTYQIPSLTCPRNVVDLYTTSSASNGNKQLGYPVALATADEMSFAGSGNSTASNGSSYNAKSFARSGSTFWLLSPDHRALFGHARGSNLTSGGYLDYSYVYLTYGVRPVISLTSGTTPESGSGTATDPWVVIPNLPTMQSIAVSDLVEGEEKTVIDARDGKDYTIKKINGYLWMTQNLRFTGTSVPSATSNVASDKTLTYYSLNSSNAGSFGAYSDHCDNTNGYNYACIYDSGYTSTGVWYNYYAASAGTISTDSNTTAASQDICPKNWHLPTGPNTTSGTDINKLVGNTTSGWQPATTGLTAFSAVEGGYYKVGSNSDSGTGYWWSATANNTTNRYYLFYYGSAGQFVGNYGNTRCYGHYVRCVRTS